MAGRVAVPDGVALTAEAVAAYGRAAVAEAVATAGLAATVGVPEATVVRGAALAETRDGKPSPPELLDETAATGWAILAGCATAETLAGVAIGQTAEAGDNASNVCWLNQVIR